MRGIEPRSLRWKRNILTIGLHGMMLLSMYVRKYKLARVGFDPTTFGLWAQHASTAPPRLVLLLGFEPRIPDSKSDVITNFTIRAKNFFLVLRNRIELLTLGLLDLRSTDWANGAKLLPLGYFTKKKLIRNTPSLYARCGTWTHDHKIKSLALYRLS